MHSRSIGEALDALGASRKRPHAGGVSSNADPLPPGWVRVESRSRPGSFYYAHPATKRTQLERPTLGKQASVSNVSTAAKVGSGVPAATQVAEKMVGPTKPANAASIRVEDDKPSEEELKRIEAKKAEEEMKRKKAEEEARKRAEEAAEAEEAAREEEFRKAREKAREKARAQEAALAKENEARDGKKNGKRKAWLEEESDDDDDAIVTLEDVEQWKEDEERREREEIEAEKRRKEEEAAAEKRREQEERQKIEDAKRQEEEDEQRMIEESLEMQQKEAEFEKAIAEKEVAHATDEAHGEDAMQEEKDQKQEHALLQQSPTHDVHIRASPEQSPGPEDTVGSQSFPSAKVVPPRIVPARMPPRPPPAPPPPGLGASLGSSADASSSSLPGLEPKARPYASRGHWSTSMPGDTPLQTGKILWYNGRRQEGMLLSDQDQKMLEIPVNGAINGAVAPPGPGGLMHGTRVTYTLTPRGAGLDPVCREVRPVEGQVGLSCGGDSQQGLRRMNEDRTIAVDLAEGLGHMVGFFDGHRGVCCADMLARQFPHAVVQCCREVFQRRGLRAGVSTSSVSAADEVELIRAGLIAAFEAVERETLAVASQQRWIDGSTAMLALLIHGFPSLPQQMSAPDPLAGGAKLFVAWCGTSRFLLLRGRQAVRCTNDHVCACPEERQWLQAAGAHVLQDVNGVWWMGWPGRPELAQARQQGYDEPMGPKSFLASSRGFGDIALKGSPGILSAVPDVRVVNIMPQDWAAVVAGRGVFKVLSDQDVADACWEAVVLNGGGPVEAARMVTERALLRGASDNVTAVVMRFGWTQPPSPAAHAMPVPSAHAMPVPFARGY